MKLLRLDKLFQHSPNARGVTATHSQISAVADPDSYCAARAYVRACDRTQVHNRRAVDAKELAGRNGSRELCQRGPRSEKLTAPMQFHVISG